VRRRARCSLELEQYHVALADTSHVLRLSVGVSRAWHMRGDAFYQLHDFDMAAKYDD